MQQIRAVPAVQGPAAVVRNPPNLPPPRRHRRPLLLLRRPVLLPRRRRRPPRKVGGPKDSRDRTDERARAADAVAVVVGAKDRRRQAQMTGRRVVQTSHRRMRGNGRTSSNSDVRMKVPIAAAAAVAVAAVTPAQLLPRVAPTNSPLHLSHGYRHIAERNHRPNAIRMLRND